MGFGRIKFLLSPWHLGGGNEHLGRRWGKDIVKLDIIEGDTEREEQSHLLFLGIQRTT